ncbi:MAG: RNA polymerase sigma factor [Jatrophihabitans sp.]|uniref:RNA polymerase sigma factor n=1 Tax=Jatrophihabitans sp. TaxID=1932789 RepID=UPI00390D3C1D
MRDDRAGFEAMFREHYDAVTRYVVRRLGRTVSPDIVSETFLVAWRRLDDVPESPLPWLYATARNLVANEIRRQQCDAALGRRLADRPAAPSADMGELIAERLAVTAALQHLSERDREVLRLVQWEGLTVADAATVMNCTQSAFKVRLHRARRRLAASMSPPPTEPHTTELGAPS